ncbi:MAG: glycosyl hydrolase family protein [Terracidiphilus sp.]
MKRRTFLLQAGAAATAAACSKASWAQRDLAVAAELTLQEGPQTTPVPLTYNGLSYELAQLTDPQFFSAANRELVAHFRLLSPNGVLRTGGNTSEFCWFQADSATVAPKLRLPPGNLEENWMPHRLFAIWPEAIDALAGFLQATGWKLIYGLNFGNSTPERAAAEAAYVAQAVGERLEFFQIGNEPDLYQNANNGTRPPGWGFADYLKEWTAYAEAIAARVPGARFGGPDVNGSSDWITSFGEEVSAEVRARLTTLTGHYYAEGPPNDPRVTTERLLAGNKKIAGEMEKIEAVAKAHGLVYRMTEGNSCYRGGKPGMSNAFAAALWAGDYMLELASLGSAGVNLHGGRSTFLTAGLGDHTPGMEVVKTPQAMRIGFYTPIFSEPDAPVKAMPIFYGMLLANQFAGGEMMRVDGLAMDGTIEGANATVYAARSGSGFKVALFNKDELKAVEVSLRMPTKVHKATAWRLQAPALDSTEGVTLAGAEIRAGEWSPRETERVAVKSGVARIRVPASSAALMFVG